MNELQQVSCSIQVWVLWWNIVFFTTPLESLLGLFKDALGQEDLWWWLHPHSMHTIFLSGKFSRLSV
jgi:hypothetical protein